MLPGERDIWRALHSMAKLDRGGGRRRGRAPRAGARGRHGPDRSAACTSRATCGPGVGVEEANDILWVITSFETFDLLDPGCGLPLDVVVERLTETAERALMSS